MNIPPSAGLSRSRSCDNLSERLVEKESTFRKSWEGIKDFVTPSRRQSANIEVEYLNDLMLPPDAFMEDVMTAIIKRKRLRRVTWLPTKNNEGHQIIFNIEAGKRCDDTVRLLSEWGVGEREGTSVSVLPCTLYYEPMQTDQKAQ